MAARRSLWKWHLSRRNQFIPRIVRSNCSVCSFVSVHWTCTSNHMVSEISPSSISSSDEIFRFLDPLSVVVSDCIRIWTIRPAKEMWMCVGAHSSGTMMYSYISCRRSLFRQYINEEFIYYSYLYNRGVRQNDLD